MPLTAGTKLGPYAVESPIGAGGMGEVYLATDTRLDRKVAIKVLPDHLSEHPGLKDRFEREARAISSLQHPNICALYDVGHENGVDFLVMEYLEGETLLARLAREKLPIEQVLEIGIKIAEALDKAHRSGIVHRDLKPGNVMLTREGVKLLDFGLARIGQVGTQPGSGSLPGLTAMATDPTPKTPLTQEGTILGTFQYMSPEQLEGKEADSRTDIFALGTLLYEMATGQRAFSGDSQASLIASIMGKEPRPISEMIPMSPPALDRVVTTCMAKVPDDRWQTAHDVALQLRWIAEGGSQAGVPATVAARRRSRERRAWIAAAVLGAAAVAFAALFALNRPQPDTKVIRFQIAPPPGANDFTYPTVSPDGQFIAFMATDSTGTSRIWVRRMDALEALPLPGTEDAQRPFWSPDSRYLGYLTGQDGKVKKVSVLGGPPSHIGDAVGYDGSWGHEDYIVFDNTSTDTLQIIKASGGTAAPTSSLDRSIGETGHVWPQFLPDGKHYLFIAAGGPDSRVLKVGEVGSMESRVLDKVDSRFQYVTSGHILFVRQGTLLAQPFDAKAMEYTGEPVPLAQNVSSGGSTFGGSFSASETGVLTFWEGQSDGGRQLVWMDREGNELEMLGDPAIYEWPCLSPDEQRLLVGIQDPRKGTADIWLRDLERGTQTRMTFADEEDRTPLWSPDGGRMAFVGTQDGVQQIFTRRTGGGSVPEPVVDPGSGEWLSDWSSDGRWLLVEIAVSGQADLVAVSADGKGDPVDIARTPFGEILGKFSPDGKWAAYQSIESGSWEIYVQSFPEASDRWQISTNGGMSPQWRRDGKELFYLAPDQTLMAVTVETDDGFRVDVPTPLFKPRVRTSPTAENRFQVADHGRRFLFNAPKNVQHTEPVTVVLHWTAALENR
jgi:Tol biopolymer transport system component/predicted Ser/Thr protein kinase